MNWHLDRFADSEFVESASLDFNPDPTSGLSKPKSPSVSVSMSEDVSNSVKSAVASSSVT